MSAMPPNTPKFDLDLLPCVVAFSTVAQSGSFSTAARQLDTTRSAISKQIQRLELAWGVRLLNRTPRSVSLTEPGRMALQAAIDMGRMAMQAHEAATSLVQAPRGQLRMTASVACGEAVLVPLLPEFTRLHPEVAVDLMLTDRFVDLAEEGFDLAVRVTKAPPEALVARRLGRVAARLCASPHLRGLAKLRVPADLARLPLLPSLQGSGDTEREWRLRRGSEEASVPVKGGIAVNSSAARLALAQQGQGVALLPDYVCAPALRRGELVTVLPEWTAQAPYGEAIWGLRLPERRVLPKVRAMTDFLVDKLREIELAQG